MNKHLVILILVIVGLWSGAVSVVAQDDPVDPENEQRSRITYVNGDVVIQPSVSGNTLEAVMNMPLMAGDRLACGADGSVEFNLGDGVNGWLWYETKIELIDSGVSSQSGRHSDLKLWYGAVAVRSIPMEQEHSVSIDTGYGRINLGKDTLVRVTVESDQTAIYLTVLKGTVSADSSGGTLSMATGETWRTMAGSGQWTSVTTPVQDTFDKWFIERDQLLSGAYTYSDQFTSEAVPSEYIDEAAALHGYGRWVSIGGNWYWSPYVASGWVPYHHGYWDYYPVWGWIWIPFEPWGWTVYHFGYWAFYYDWGWLWFPSWRWRGHYAHWRTDGRTVHWIAAHPEDDMDANGLLRQGAVPRNSQLAIGIPVEAGQSVDQMMNRTPIIRNTIASNPADTSPWIGKLPDSFKPSLLRRPGLDRTIAEPPARIQRYGQPAVRDSYPMQHRQTYGGINSKPVNPYRNNQSVSPNPYRNPSRYPTYPARRPEVNRTIKPPVTTKPPVNNHPGPAVKPESRPQVKPPVKPPVKAPLTPDPGSLNKTVAPAIKGAGILNLFQKGLSGGVVKGGAKILGNGDAAAALLKAN